MTAPDFSELKQKLLDDLDALVRELVPGGKRAGKYWIARNPARLDDAHAGSFWVLLHGPTKGAWRDEALPRGTAEGDVVDLVRYCLRHTDRAETRTWCLRRFNYVGGPAGKARPPSAAEIEAAKKRRAEKMEREAQAEAERRAAGAASAFGLWLKAAKLDPQSFPGSIADVYFRSRALDLTAGFTARGRELPGALRLFQNHDYHAGEGEILDGFPCLAAAMTGPDGKVRAIHRTWLQPDGSGKAVLPDGLPQRKIWPAGWGGSVIRIAKGAGNLTPEAAAKAGRRDMLIVAEGIEDALSLAIALPERRVWAAGTLGNIGFVPMLPCVSAVTVAADNDWTKPQAMRALDQAIAALKRTGIRVSVARSPRGKDFNDLLMGESA